MPVLLLDSQQLSRLYKFTCSTFSVLPVLLPPCIRRRRFGKAGKAFNFFHLISSVGYCGANIAIHHLLDQKAAHGRHGSLYFHRKVYLTYHTIVLRYHQCFSLLLSVHHDKTFILPNAVCTKSPHYRRHFYFVTSLRERSIQFRVGTN